MKTFLGKNCNEVLHFLAAVLLVTSCQLSYSMEHGWFSEPPKPSQSQRVSVVVESVCSCHENTFVTSHLLTVSILNTSPTRGVVNTDRCFSAWTFHTVT